MPVAALAHRLAHWQTPKYIPRPPAGFGRRPPGTGPVKISSGRAPGRRHGPRRIRVRAAVTVAAALEFPVSGLERARESESEITAPAPGQSFGLGPIVKFGRPHRDLAAAGPLTRTQSPYGGTGSVALAQVPALGFPGLKCYLYTLTYFKGFLANSRRLSKHWLPKVHCNSLTCSCNGHRPVDRWSRSYSPGGRGVGNGVAARTNFYERIQRAGRPGGGPGVAAHGKCGILKGLRVSACVGRQPLGALPRSAWCHSNPAPGSLGHSARTCQ